ncbi:MAG: hypothetical protein ACI4BA_00205 [Prevotella sp.]
MKKLATKLLVALGLLTSGGVMAQTLTNEAVTATWAFDLGTSGQLAVMTDGNGGDVTSDYFKGSNVAIGSNFTWGTLKTITDADPDGSTVKETSVVCSSKQSSALTDGSQYVDFTITPKKGLTFTPTSVSFRATRHGTGGGKLNIYWLNSDGTSVSLATGQTPNRENGQDANSTTTEYKYTDYSYTVKDAAASNAASGLRIQIYNLDGGKHYGFCNIVITGTLSGTIEQETLYTIETSVTPNGAGTITQSPAGTNIALGEKVTFTPVANTGYTFLNKWTVNGVESEGATYTIESLSENTTVVAQFEKNPVLSFAKPEDVYCVNRMFPADINTVVKGGKTTLPAANYMYYKEGYTMTGWKIGETNYEFGAEVTLNEDITAEPVFAENTVSLVTRNSDVTVAYNFKQSENGGRVVNIENNADKVITLITVDEQQIDYVMDADCKDNAGIDGKRGKLNNTGGTTAQCNQGTVLYIHDAVVGSKVTLNCSGANFTDATTFNGIAGTPSSDKKSISYTATEDGDVKVIVANEKVYLTTITITYPYVPKSYVLEAADANFYSLYLDYAVTVPENVTAYTGTINGDKLALSEIADGYIKAGNAVLVKGSVAGTYTFTEKMDAETGTYEGNDLKGVLTETAVEDLNAEGTVLTLGTDDSGSVGFRKPYETYVSANKAYLDYSVVSTAAGAPAFVEIVLPGEATGIEAIQSVQQKAADSAIYNMMGQRVGANAKGLILMNGKKMIRK